MTVSAWAPAYIAHRSRAVYFTDTSFLQTCLRFHMMQIPQCISCVRLDRIHIQDRRFHNDTRNKKIWFSDCSFHGLFLRVENIVNYDRLVFCQIVVFFVVSDCRHFRSYAARCVIIFVFWRSCRFIRSVRLYYNHAVLPSIKYVMISRARYACFLPVRGSRPAVTPLYHGFRDLSIGFSKFLKKIFSAVFVPLTVSCRGGGFIIYYGSVTKNYQTVNKPRKMEQMEQISRKTCSTRKSLELRHFFYYYILFNIIL